MLVPEIENLDEDGAQQRVWDLSRLFLDTLQETLGDQVIVSTLVTPCVTRLCRCTSVAGAVGWNILLIFFLRTCFVVAFFSSNLGFVYVLCLPMASKNS